MSKQQRQERQDDCSKGKETMNGSNSSSRRNKNGKRRSWTRTSSSESNKQQHEQQEQQEEQGLDTTRTTRRRRSRRGYSSGLHELGTLLVSQQNVVFITGAGLSVASGVRPFRGTEGLWSQVVWTKATRESFRQDPLGWYNDFWIPHFCLPETYQANAGHEALSQITQLSPQVKIITQNIDGLQHVHNPQNLIEAHGRVGLYKCLPDDDSDTDSDDDIDDDRLVHLGHRRKKQQLLQSHSKVVSEHNEIIENQNCKEMNTNQHQHQHDNIRDNVNNTSSNHNIGSTCTPNITTTTTKTPKCKYEWKESMTIRELQPPHVRDILSHSHHTHSATTSTTTRKTTTRRRTSQRRSSSSSSSSLSSSSTTATNNSTWKDGDNNNNNNNNNNNTHTPTSSSASSFVLYDNLPKLSTVPKCPDCQRPCPPQALLFDEGYHSHHFYQFTKMEDWLSEASAIVFVGTSFAVRITDVALEHARSHHIPVFNFNTTDVLESTIRLNATNILGPSHETLVKLYQTCQDIQNGK